MALPATDNFNGTPGDNIADYSSNWSVVRADPAFRIYSDGGSLLGVQPYSGGSNQDSAARWNADSFDNDQYAEIIYQDEGSNNFRRIGPAVRCSSSAITYYGYYTDDAAARLFKYVAGSYTQIGSDGDPWTDKDVARLEISGTTLTPMLNDSEDTSIEAQTDISISSGSAGICGYGTSSHNSGDDWEGGNLGPSIIEGIAALSGTGALSAIGSISLVAGVAALSGTGSLTAIGNTLAVLGVATLSGTGNLSAIGLGIQAGISALSGTGSLTSIGLGIQPGIATLSGTGSLSGVGLGIQVGIVAFDGTGALIVIPSAIQSAVVTLSGTGVLSAIGTEHLLLGASVLSGTGSLAGIGLGIQPAVATLGSTGSLTVVPSAIQSAVAALSGTGALSTVGSFALRVGVAALSGTGTLVAIGDTLAIEGVAALSGTGSLAAIILAVISGVTTWGHDTGVQETNIRNFSLWTGTGSVENSGDSERLALQSGQNMISEAVFTGSRLVCLDQNRYQSGDTVTLERRTGSTLAACESAGWTAYSGPFTSSGFVQIRVTSTL